MTDSITIGSTPGSSAINGDSIVANLANKLQTPKAVPVSATGKTYGVARYESLKANETPNLQNKTHAAMAPGEELKKLAKRMPPAAPALNAIMNDNFTPTAFIKNPLAT